MSNSLRKLKLDDHYKISRYMMDLLRIVTKGLDQKVAVKRERAIEWNVFVAGAWGRCDRAARNGIFARISDRLRNLVYVEGDL